MHVSTAIPFYRGHFARDLIPSQNGKFSRGIAVYARWHGGQMSLRYMYTGVRSKAAISIGAFYGRRVFPRKKRRKSGGINK